MYKYCDATLKGTDMTQPAYDMLEMWMMEGICETPDGCIVEPDGVCEHGLESWLLLLGIL